MIQILMLHGAQSLDRRFHFFSNELVYFSCTVLLNLIYLRLILNFGYWIENIRNTSWGSCHAVPLKESDMNGIICFCQIKVCQHSHITADAGTGAGPFTRS